MSGHETPPPGDARYGRIRCSAERLRHAGVRQESLRRASEELGQQGAQLRMWAADLAAQMASQAVGFATYLEQSAGRGDPQQRRQIAAAEHEVARIANRTASKLRDLTCAYERGERLPRLPGATSQPDDRPADHRPDGG